MESGDFGVDVRWGGSVGNTRANQVRTSLEAAGYAAKLRQDFGDGWIVRLGPMPGAEVGKILETFLL